MAESTRTLAGGFYQRWLGPVLANDEGLDAEQLSRTALTALGQASPVSYTHLRAHET